MNLKKIAIIGGSGFGREVKMLIDQINEQNSKYEIIGFYDDDTNLPDLINDKPLLGRIDDLNKIDFPCNVAIAIGDPQIKEEVFQRLNNTNLSFPNLIHPSVIMSKDYFKLGQGNIFCAGVIITTSIEFNNFIILNLGCTVGHDTIIKSFCSLMPSVNISGQVLLEEKVYIGTGAKIINNLTIGKNTTIGAGAVVSKSIESNCVAVGIPAKPIKFKNT